MLQRDVSKLPVRLPNEALDLFERMGLPAKQAEVQLLIDSLPIMGQSRESFWTPTLSFGVIATIR